MEYGQVLCVPAATSAVIILSLVRELNGPDVGIHRHSILAWDRMYAEDRAIFYRISVLPLCFSLDAAVLRAGRKGLSQGEPFFLLIVLNSANFGAGRLRAPLSGRKVTVQQSPYRPRGP
jgi:hypothetical protein